MRRKTYYPFSFAVFPDYELLSEYAASAVADCIEANPGAMICVASGSTPRLTYERLPRIIDERNTEVGTMRLLKLDEWLDLPRGSAGTCEAQLTTQLVDPLGLRSEQYIAFESDPPDAQEECDRVQMEVRRHGPIDLAVLGLGRNGHLGFNEPAPALIPGCHVALLSPESQEHPMVRGAGAPPSRGITLGIADILRARRILLLANGTEKREQVRRMVDGAVDPTFPASFLALHHAVECCIDEEAAALLDTL